MCVLCEDWLIELVIIMARFVRKNGLHSYLKKLKASYLYCMYMF